MKKKLIRLFIAVGLVLGVGSCADVTDIPEYYGVYKEANIENIRPSSWLREILQRQRDGLGLNRKESGYPYNTCLWNGIIPEGGNPIAKGWWPYEQSGYMIDGLYRCGIFLRDKCTYAARFRQCRICLVPSPGERNARSGNPR